MYDIKDIKIDLNSHYGVSSYYGWFPFQIFKKGRDKMTFEIIRLFVILTETGLESSLSDFDVIIYDINYENHNILIKKWDEIPDCFNCKVLSYSFDFETKRIYIKSEVAQHDKI